MLKKIQQKYNSYLCS